MASLARHSPHHAPSAARAPAIGPVATCRCPVLGLGRRIALAGRRGRPRRDDDAARASASPWASSSSPAPDGGEGGGEADGSSGPPSDALIATTTAAAPERRASRSRHAELLDRELAAVRAGPGGRDAAALRAALRALGEEEDQEDKGADEGGANEDEQGKKTGVPNAAAGPPSSAATVAALQRRLAAARLRERARVVRLPLRYTSSGRRAASRRYPTVPVDVEGVGFTDFLLDAGVYGAAITPALRDRLGLAPTDGAAVTALASGGATVRQRVRLPDLWIGTARLPSLQATVGPLPSAALPASGGQPQQQQQQQSPQQQQQQRPLSPSAAARAAAAAAAASSSSPSEPPGGLLGVKALRQFDLDFDPRAGCLGLHPAGHAAAGLLDVSGLRPVACRFTRAGLVCLPVALGLAGAGGGSGGIGGPQQLPPPAVLGILDLSATVSVLNWQAAALLGMECEAALRERDEEEREEQEGEEGEEGEQKEGAAAGAGESSRRPRRPLDYRGHYGQIVFADPAAPALLERPAPPAAPRPPAPALPAPPPPAPSRRRADGVRSTRLELQEHRAAARLVLGDPRVGGGRVELRPPARVAVAHLKGLAQLGLGEQPAALIGQDVWAARGRAVLCLKEGLLYLE